MHELHKSPQEIDRQLAAARRALQEFEDGVDRKRLVQRLKTASPAHPVLLFRFLFGAAGLLFVIASVLVLAIAQINQDVARAVAKFEMVSPLPEEVPLLPTLLGGLAAAMFFAWLMATFAAWALGRDAPMLAWEQKHHQKLVNEVTRLGTQKAVTERIKNTPAGARPRIATPVPTGGRRSVPASPPSGAAFNRAGLGGFTPSHAPAQARSAGPAPAPTAAPSQMASQVTASQVTASQGTASQGTASQPRSARQGPAPSLSPYGPPPGTPAGATPTAAAGLARSRDRGGLGGRSAPTPGPAGVRLGQPPVHTPGREPSVSALGREPSVHAPGPSSFATREAAPAPVPVPVPIPAVVQFTDAAATTFDSDAGDPAPTEPMVRPAHSLRPAPELPRNQPRPQAARPTFSANPTLAPVPRDEGPMAAAWPDGGGGLARDGGRPGIVLPPLRDGLRAGVIPDDDTTVEDDGAEQDDDYGHEDGGPNGASNRAFEGRLVGVDDDGPRPDEIPPVYPRIRPPPDGILGQAQAGTNISRPTPFGSAGRIRLPTPATLRISTAPLPMGQSTRGGTPLGAPPKAGVPVGQAEPRLASDVALDTRSGALAPDSRSVGPAFSSGGLGGFPGTPGGADRADDATPVVDLADLPELFGAEVEEDDDFEGGHSSAQDPATTGVFPVRFSSASMFGTPPPESRIGAEVLVEGSLTDEDEDTGTIEFDVDPAQEGLVIVEESEEYPLQDLQDDMPTIMPTPSMPRSRTPVSTSSARSAPPQESWLSDALARVETLGKGLPTQAVVQLSREPHLPFTLVITRATPALAVRAMVSFVEFLASIATPPRARIELVGVAHLDRSFHKNVVAALEPYFGADSEVDHSAGQVDIRFTDPDPVWAEHPRLPV